MDSPILECIPNFSEGRDPEKIAAIAGAIRSVEGASLLHIDTSPAANRTVMTFAGAPEAVTEAAFRAIRKAAEVIDMRQQEGVHPRIGATDVCPLVPLAGMTLAEADRWAKELGSRVGAELGIPVYLYEHSAPSAARRALPDIRKGHYEGFAEKMRQPDWAPDYGPADFNAAAGATVIGARKILVAFNISLATGDVSVADTIAARLRSRGSSHRDAKGQLVKTPGLFPKLRAIGWYMADYNNAQVSFNLLDYTTTQPLQVYEACRQLAEELGTSIVGSEVIGLIPEECLLEAGAFAQLKKGQTTETGRDYLVHEGAAHLKLAALKPFEPVEKVLEYALRAAGIPITRIIRPEA